MARNVADLLWEMLEQAGVERCYGIVEEYGVFAAVADSYLTDSPVVVCGTVGPGTANPYDTMIKTIEHDVRLLV